MNMTQNNQKCIDAHVVLANQISALCYAKLNAQRILHPIDIIMTKRTRLVQTHHSAPPSPSSPSPPRP